MVAIAVGPAVAAMGIAAAGILKAVRMPADAVEIITGVAGIGAGIDTVRTERRVERIAVIVARLQLSAKIEPPEAPPGPPCGGAVSGAPP